MIRGTTRLVSVIGWPVDHSRSPAMLNAAFTADQIDAVMVPANVAPDQLPAFVAGLRAMQMLGASVTLPHKHAIAALCDELAPAARAIGAVNCLHRDGARVIGHNTDAPGFVDALAAAGFDPGGKRCVVLGGGGAARAVAYALAEATLTVVTRRPIDWPAESAKSIDARPWSDLADCFAHAELIVDCTSAGLDPVTDAAFELPIEALAPGAWVATLVYHRRTSLVERASARGHSTLDGRAMLVHQGARAFTLWTGHPAPIAVMTRALEASLVKNE